MADNNKVIVELGRVIKNRREYNPDASPLVKYFEENIVQKQGNSYIAYPTALVNDGVLDGKYYLTRAPYNDDPQTPNAGWEVFASGKHNFKTGEDIEDVSIATDSDFTNPDATKRAKVPTVGAILDGLNDGIYDVSKRNPTAGPNSDGKFTLEYILNNANTLIPTSWRHGGMTISFVDSSDNKYVQYRCIADEFTTDINQWSISPVIKVVESPEFDYVFLTKDKRILFGVQKDGNFYFGAGLPLQVVEYINGKIAELGLGSVNDIIAFLGDLVNGDNLATLLNAKADKGTTYTKEEVNTALSGKVDKVGGKSLIDEDVADMFSCIDNPEFKYVFYDEEKRIYYGLKQDGDFFFGYGVPSQIVSYITEIANTKQDKEEGKGLSSNDFTNAEKAKLASITLNKSMKVTKSGTDVVIRTSLSDENDIVITFYQSNDGHNMCPYKVYVGGKSLTDEQIKTNTYFVHQISDSVGAIGIKTFWFLYAQHGWAVPRVQMSSVTVDASDIGSLWKDQNDNRFVLGNIQGNYVFFLPEVTLVDGIYKASWDPIIADMPTQFTHISGATHTNVITGTITKPQIQIQTAIERKFLCDGTPIIEDGTYYCDEFNIFEHILGHNPAEVSYYPSFTYGSSLIDWDRSFIIKGSAITCNTLINCQYPFEITDYRGCIPQMPLQKGDYHSYTLIPKVKKLVNGHRVDLPFNSDDGTLNDNQVLVTRNSSDLYDVDKQPERCITYLKDSSDNFLVGVAGGASLIKGISLPENRNIYCPVGENTCTYGGSSSTLNKFYPKLLQATGFESSIVPNTFVKEMSCYYTWFDPNKNNGQVFWYKDNESYIVYIHNQEAHDKLDVILPKFMEGMVVSETIEKTSGATLLSEQVISNRVYVSFDTTDNTANYIVLRLI